MNRNKNKYALKIASLFASTCFFISFALSLAFSFVGADGDGDVGVGVCDGEEP